MQAKNNDFILKIKRDDDPEDPREWENLSTMVCYHRRYKLGDQHNHENPGDFLSYLVELVTGDTEEAERKLEELTESVDMKLYRGYGNYKRAVDDAILAYIEDNGIIVLPLFLFDHGGITMNTTGFSCPWDSGQVGWIYTTKQKLIEETGYTESELFSNNPHRPPDIKEHVKVKERGVGRVIEINDDELTVDLDYNKIPQAKEPGNIIKCKQEDIEVFSNMAEELLRNEVEIYDHYLQGNVYGYVLEKKTYRQPCEEGADCNACDACDEVEIEEVDNCWGYYGDDFKENGILDAIGLEHEDLIDNLEYV